MGQIDRSVERPFWAENLGGGIQKAALSKTRLADVGEIKEVGAGYTPSGVDAKVKRGVKQELALSLKRNLLLSVHQ